MTTTNSIVLTAGRDHRRGILGRLATSHEAFESRTVRALVRSPHGGHDAIRPPRVAGPMCPGVGP